MVEEKEMERVKRKCGATVSAHKFIIHLTLKQQQNGKRKKAKWPNLCLGLDNYNK